MHECLNARFAVVIRGARSFAAFSVIGLACTGASAGAPGRADESDGTEALINNVLANELLYERLECRFRINYEHVGPRPRAADGSTVFLTVEQHEAVRSVSQGQRFRIEVAGSLLRDGSDEPAPADRIRVFDGAKTRVRDEGVVNVIDGPAMDKLILAPHMLLLSVCGYPVRLSTYLHGERAMRAAPDVYHLDDARIDVRCLGEAEFAGLRCEKVRITHVEGGFETIAWDLWLAIDRNYIPALLHGYTFRWSRDVPIGQAQALSFVEVEPGIWFPREVTIESFDPFVVKKQNEQRVLWRRSVTTESVSLRADYPVSFFSDLDVQEGTAVYELGADRKLKNSYVHGTPGSLLRPLVARHWLLWLNAALATISVWWLLSRRRPTRRQTPDYSTTDDG